MIIPLKTKYVLLSFIVCLLATLPVSSQEIPVEVKRRIYKNGKAHYTDWQTFPTVIIDHLTQFKPATITPDRYGYPTTIKGAKTGFYHPEKIGKRWYMVNPDGYAGLNVAVNSVSKSITPGTKAAYERKFKTTDVWINETVKLIKENGYNAVGNWSDVKAVQAYNATSDSPIGYTVSLNWMSGYGKKRGGTYAKPGHTGYPQDCIFVFDEGFEEYCMQEAKKLAALSNDPNLIGYFSDNEMPLSKNNLKNYLKLPETDPGYIAASAYLKSKKITLEKIQDKHLEEFAGMVAERYYSIVNKAIKTYDKNHLYLGSRLHGGAPHVESIYKANAKYVDVISINYYGQWQLKDEHRKNWEKWADKPYLITEFYTKGEDSRLPNQSGAGWIVRDQTARGYAYQHFLLSFLETKHCIGWHWFKYIDNDPSNKKAELSNIDGNKGMLNGSYEPYTDLVKYMKQLNTQYLSLIDYFK